MPFLLLLVLTLICLQREWPEPPWAGLAGGVALTWAGVSIFLGEAWVAARRVRRRLTDDLATRAGLLRRHASFRRRHVLALITFYLIAVCVLGWGRAVRELFGRGENSLPGVELILLTPLLAGLLLSWALFYDVERAAHATSPFPDDNADPFPGRWSYVAVQARHNLLLIVPPLVLMLVQQTALVLFPGLQRDELLLPVFGAVLLAGVFIGIPWLLRLVLGLRPLPDGPLRARLLAAARRLKFRFSDVLVWDTRNTVANAMVTGPLPWLRYVVLTDRLIREMTPDEIEAVFGHEVGHIRHRHMLFYFGFLLASLVVVLVLWKAAEAVLLREPVQAFLDEHFGGLMEALRAYKVLAVVPLLALLAAYLFVVFGFLSRRCERQADIYGCRTVSVEVFIEALEKVARLNGISRERPGWLSSWQHSTIARRVEFLQQMSADPEVEPRFQRAVGWVKWGMALSLGAAFGLLLWALGTEEMLKILREL
jgi:Zn-dependent protease with chaperone function